MANALPLLSRLLLDLHRGARDIAADCFQHWALERLRRDLHFDSAIWASGAGSDQGPIFHSIHLQHLPAQLLLDYEPLKPHDRLFAQCMAMPGVTIRADGRIDLPEIFQPYLDRYKLAQGLCTMTMDEATALLTGVSLYRSDHAHAFSDDEAALMNAVFPHLQETESRNKLLRLQEEAHSRSPAQAGAGYAACDGKGLLRYVDDAFCRAMQRTTQRSGRDRLDRGVARAPIELRGSRVRSCPGCGSLRLVCRALGRRRGSALRRQMAGAAESVDAEPRLQRVCRVARRQGR